MPHESFFNQDHCWGAHFFTVRRAVGGIRPYVRHHSGDVQRQQTLLVIPIMIRSLDAFGNGKSASPTRRGGRRVLFSSLVCPSLSFVDLDVKRTHHIFFG